MILNDRERKEAEQSVIGSMILDQRCIPKVAAMLKPEDFVPEVHQIIFEAAVDKSERGVLFDKIIAVDIAQTKLGDDAAKYILELLEMTPTASNAVEYAKIVKKHAGIRYLRESISELASDDPQEFAGDVIGLCQGYLQDNRTTRLKTLKDALMTMYNAKRDITSVLRIDTGLPKLDYLLKGLCGGNLIIIAARPKVGKSAFAMQIAKSAAEKGNRTMMVSMEMLDEEVAERYVSRDNRLSMDKLIDGNLSVEDWTAIGEVANALSKLPIYLCDEPRMSVAKIRAMARSIRDLKLIVVDYLTLMESGKRYEHRYLEIGAMTRELKTLAVELKIPVVVLSQLNREKKDTQEPQLGDLRESGNIEQDANKVVMLWRLDENTPEDAPLPIGCKVAANRRGRTGVVNMMFDGAHMRFTETETRYEPPQQKRGRREFE